MTPPSLCGVNLDASRTDWPTMGLQGRKKDAVRPSLLFLEEAATPQLRRRCSQHPWLEWKVRNEPSSGVGAVVRWVKHCEMRVGGGAKEERLVK